MFLNAPLIDLHSHESVATSQVGFGYDGEMLLSNTLGSNWLHLF